MSTRVPAVGFCIATGSRGYNSCHHKLKAAVKAGRVLAQRTGRRVDIVSVSNHGEDRYVIAEMFPKYARRS